MLDEVKKKGRHMSSFFGFSDAVDEKISYDQIKGGTMGLRIFNYFRINTSQLVSSIRAIIRSTTSILKEYSCISNSKKSSYSEMNTLLQL